MEFSVYNPTESPIYVLKRLTPLEGLLSDCLNVNGSDGTKIPYKGIYVFRVATPDSNEYILLGPLSTYAKSIDISAGYASVRSRGGRYNIAVKGNVRHYAAHDFASGSHFASSLNKSSEVREQVSASAEIDVNTATPASDANEQTLQRNLRTDNSYNMREPRVATNRPAAAAAPNIIGFSAAQRAEIIRSHEASAVYLWSAIQIMQHYSSDMNANQQYINYFGAIYANRYTTTTNNYIKMYNAITTQQITYSDNTGATCDNGYIAYTYGGLNGQPIFLCTLFFDNNVVPFSDSAQNRFNTIIHELSHGWLETGDTDYGVSAGKETARNNPAQAIASANCVGYFSSMTFPLDWGIDTISTIPSGGTYATIGPIYFKYKSDLSTVEPGYPRPINAFWGNIPASFGLSFDSLISIGTKTYVTKGSQYVRYSDETASTVDSGYPLSIAGNWGNTPTSFNQGFDTMGYLHNGKLYIFKGNQYLRYSDDGNTVDIGYPKSISDWNLFGRFDAMLLTNVGGQYTYIISGKQYARCSDSECNVIDHISNLRGNWGRMAYYE